MKLVTDPINEALFPPELWQTALEKYATAADLTVHLFDTQERPVLGPIHLTPLFELFEPTGYNSRFFARSARAALGHSGNGSAVKVSQFHGLSTVSASLALEGKRVGTAVAGYVFAEFSQVSEIHWLARDAGISFDRLWAVARKQQPMPERRLVVLGELLQTLGEALLRENLRTRQSQHAGAIIASSGDAIISENLYGVITAWNAGAERLYGYSAGEAMGKPIMPMLKPPGRVEEEPDILRRIREGESVEHYETVHRRKDGVLRDISLTVSPITDGRGRIVGASAIAHDITARKRAETALRESEGRFRSLVEASSEVLYRMNPDWSEMRQLAGGRFLSDTTEPNGHWFEAYIPREEQPRVRAAIEEAVGRKKVFELEHRVRRADGSVGWAFSRAVPVVDEAGQLVEWFGAANDVTERKRAEAALRRSEERLTQAVRVGGLGVFEHDHRSDQIEFSPALRGLLGFGEDAEVTLDLFLARVLPEDREGLAEAIRRAHDPAGHGMFEVEYRVAGQDGRTRWLSARSQTFFEGEGSERRPVRTIGAVVDVTERKDRQAELERLVGERTGELQELVGELEHFSYSITHDLKAPLRAMKGYAEIASEKSGDAVQGEGKEALARISTSAERMERLITDALKYGRAVRQELPLTEVDTGALLRGMLESYPELQASRADIRVDGELPVVVGNEAGLTQCFSNLLGNAVKFVKPGERPQIRVWAEQTQGEGIGGLMDKWINEPGTPPSSSRHSSNNPSIHQSNNPPIHPSSSGGWARLWIEDQGIGISREMLPRVFDMFSRGSRSYEGTGIGLALVRKVVQQMGGRVGVESEEGRGSRFWMELRLGQARPRERQAKAAPADPNSSGLVLYVEDDENDAMFMQRAFAQAGLESALRVVTDGRAALEYLSGSGKYADRKEYPLPSVVLLDLNLPQVPGFEVLKWIRNYPAFARMPVVMFSSSSREDDRTKALELGANEFVAKPSSALRYGEVVEGLREKWMVDS